MQRVVYVTMLITLTRLNLNAAEGRLPYAATPQQYLRVSGGRGVNRPAVPTAVRSGGLVVPEASISTRGRVDRE